MMPPAVPIHKEDLERAARLYRRRIDAARALGISPTSLWRALRRYGLTARWEQKP